MSFSDLIFIFQWWMVFFGIGLVFLPLTIKIFPNFFDRGYIFAKILGIIILSYTVFLLGSLKILPFTQSSIFLVLIIFLILNVYLISKYLNILISFRKSFWIFIFEELLFLGALLLWSYIRAHQPDINGLEKFMDFGFINSILRSEYFPPKDMWFTPYPINYYYFGHLITAVLTKLSGIPSLITYNLMLSTIFAFTFTASFSIGASLVSLLQQRARGDTTGRDPDSAHALFRRNTSGALAGMKVGAGPRAILGGFITAFLVSFAGNLHSIYAFFKPYVNEDPVPIWQLIFSPQTFPNAYWYPNATRFIQNTIHEFPLYSFVVSDLHGHVLDIPVVLLTIAVLLQVVILRERSERRIQNDILVLLLISFLLAVMYMTNAWDGIIYFLLTIIVIYYIKLKSHRILHTTYYILLLVVGFLVFSLPFSLNFKPFVSGIGVLCAPQFLTDIERLGPFLFEADHCQKSPLWQLAVLYGFFYFFAISFIVFLYKKIQSSKFKVQNYNSKLKIFNFKLFTFN